jgi:hypothetical protein
MYKIQVAKYSRLKIAMLKWLRFHVCDATSLAARMPYEARYDAGMPAKRDTIWSKKMDDGDA